MILESVEHGPLIWPTVEENNVIRTKKYAELSAAEKIQADCYMKATNIILQGLHADIYSLMNHHIVAKDLWERVQLLTQAMAFLTAIASSRFPSTNNQLRTFSNIRNQATIQDDKDLDTYDSNCDDLSIAQAVLIDNISNYAYDVISENEYCINQNAPEIPEYFKKNDLKAQLQDKDMTICKLKDTTKSLRKNNNKKEIIDHDRCDLATSNEELENGVAKLLFENKRLCKEINHVKQELLVYVQDTYPSVIKLSETKMAITPMNIIKKVTFAKPIPSSRTNQEAHDSNKPVLHSTGVKCSTRDSGSKPSCNTKNYKIS
nr:hypothetical protein [Tanacetum cinerariifolium]